MAEERKNLGPTFELHIHNNDKASVQEQHIGNRTELHGCKVDKVVAEMPKNGPDQDREHTSEGVSGSVESDNRTSFRPDLAKYTAKHPEKEVSFEKSDQAVLGSKKTGQAMMDSKETGRAMLDDDENEKKSLLKDPSPATDSTRKFWTKTNVAIAAFVLVISAILVCIVLLVLNLQDQVASNKEMNSILSSLQSDHKNMTAYMQSLKRYIPKCANGDIYYGDNCFEIDVTERNFASSQSKCKSRDSTVGYISDKAHYDVMINRLTRGTARYFWLGLRQNLSTGAVTVISNGLKAPFLNWKSGEPGRGSSETNILLWISTSANYNWMEDGDPAWTAGVICQYKSS